MSSNRLHQAEKIDTQARNSLLKPNAQLDHALSNSEANGLPAITISALQGQYLAIQCKLINAKSVLEIGTLGGYSTIWFAGTGAKVTSIEIDAKHRDVALENTKGLDVDIILGAALDVLPRLAAQGRKFDFVFIDAAWQEQYEELLEHEDVGEGESLVTNVGREKSVTATLVSTLSSHKGNEEQMFDGFLLAVVHEG
ncbi:Caffeoyl-CoA O-methyltransferase [Lachnellula arida]|uniref:Caffeoyl-CoA O-methyltransferase n=1 Tax=Lachnellula arida TaxID=1316785 RepID=A0A8T9BR35_9HELO|nr:Caffeoyl-CoA O-methyltransferase [Lachnellula arida]